MISIPLVGVMIINSLLVLPGAASRNFARNTSAYILWAVVFSVVSGVTGLVVSYYWDGIRSDDCFRSGVILCRCWQFVSKLAKEIT
jgi:ABC-type Mn2+/Zn2+ transport system permease subunit